jgi:hypothetical protein
MNISNRHKMDEFTHDNSIISKLSNFIPMTTSSCIENAQNLYMTQTKLESNGNTKF